MAEAEDDNHVLSKVNITVPPFTEAAAAVILENLRKNENWEESYLIIKTWIDRGELIKESSDTFYAILEALHNRAVLMQKNILESRKEAKAMLKTFKKRSLQRLRDMAFMSCFEAAANFGDDLDEDFTGTEQEIEQWKIARESLLTEFRKTERDKKLDEIWELNVERDALLKEIEKCQYDIQVHEERYYEELKILDQEELNYGLELENANKELLTVKLMEFNKDSTNTALQSLKRKHINEAENTDPIHAENTDPIHAENTEPIHAENTDPIHAENTDPIPAEDGTSACASSSRILENEARLISLISACLLISPSGRSLDNIYNYIHEFISNVGASDIEYLMKKYPSVYCEKISRHGTKKWHFLG